MEHNWRAGLAPESRSRIVSRIMDTLQRNTPISGQDDMAELWKIAIRIEEKTFYAASDQHDYLREISLKMLNIETSSQNATNGAVLTDSSGMDQRPLASGVTQVVEPAQGRMFHYAIQGSASGRSASSFSSPNNAAEPASVMNAFGQLSGNLPALNVSQEIAQLQQARLQQQQISLQQHDDVYQRSQAQVGTGNSLQQVGQAGGVDEADIAWSKMQGLKNKYLQDMKDLCGMLTTRSELHMPEEQQQKLTHYQNMLQQMIPYLLASKGSLPKELKQDQVEAIEKCIVCTLEVFKQRKEVAAQPQDQGNLGQVQAGQQVQQAVQNFQPSNKPMQQRAPKKNSLLQSSNASFPSFESDLKSLAKNASVDIWTRNTATPTVSPKTVAQKAGTGQVVASASLATVAATAGHLFSIFVCLLILTYFLHIISWGGMTI